MTSRLIIAHSSKQDDLIFSDAEITIGATGTQWGKSLGGSLWMKRQIHTDFDPKANFIIGAPTYKILQQSALPYFLEAMESYGEYKRGEDRFQIKGGGSVYLRTETDPDSIVGIPNVKAGWLDEAGKLRLYFIENYLARVAAKGAKSLWTTSPYARNWIWRNYIKPKLAHTLPDEELTLIQASSWENPYHALHDPIKRQKFKAQMDVRRFDMLFGGEWGQLAGLVYDCFDETKNIIPSDTEIPFGSRVVGGIDWGTTDPFVLLVRAITPTGKHIQISEFYKTGLTLFDMIEVAKQKQRIYDIERFYCGQDQPGHVLEFNRNRLPCDPVDNDIRYGVDLHYELIKTGRFQIREGSSPYTLDELETYHYPEPEDLKPDQDAKEALPVGQNDHCMDASRYTTMGTYWSRSIRDPRERYKLLLGESVAIDLKPPNNKKRLKDLMTPTSVRGKRTEKWGGE